ncbi:MAG: class I SAM-dependent methyltransferase [Acutalibacteraceae bacterium]
MYKYERTPQMTYFMKNACEYTSYNAELAKLIKLECNDNTGSICDAGCGLGYLSIELSRYFKKVTAIDIDPNAIAVLKKNITKRSINNIKTVCTDAIEYRADKKFNSMVFCFFGAMDDTLRISVKNCTGKVFIVGRNWDEHRFSLKNEIRPHFTTKQKCDYLNKLKIPYKLSYLSTDMGQPLRDEQEAISFFKLYNRSNELNKITFDDIKEKLIPSDKADYKYYLPMKKELCIIICEASSFRDKL